MPRLTIGVLVDRYDMADFAVKEAEASLSTAKKKRKVIEDQLLDKFKKDDLDGASGSQMGSKISLQKLKSPTIKDRAKLNAYIARRKAYDLFQSRVNKQAWLDRMEADGKPIPGVETYERVSLKLTRSRK